MPTGPHHGWRRIAGVVALVGAVVAVALILTRSSGHYRLHAVFQDAGQLVKGNRVTVGGIQIGSIKTIKLDDHNRAVVTMDITDDAFHPLHTGTTAMIRSPSLSTQAGRYISLHPGPDSNPALADGASLGPEVTEGSVDLDALFNTLDYQTRSNLQGIVHGFADQFAGGQARKANEALRMLNPALSRTQRLTGELVRDQAAFERFIVQSSAVVGALAPRSPELQHGLTSAASLTQRLATENQAIGDVLDRSPGVLRQATGTLAHVETALRASRPTLRATRPVAPRLARVLRLVAPVARDARPAVADLSALLPDVERALRGLPKTAKGGVAAFDSTTATLKGAAPLVATLRPYVPDLVAGLFNGFGGNVAGYYDANGRYARIGFELPPGFLTQGFQGVGGPIAQLLNQGLGGGYSEQFPNYCPGGSVIPADSTMPWVPDEVRGHCDPGLTPKP
ncbi:MAG TPA: MlaD family protein [Casimicrobiaceae bacterium]